MIEWKKVDHGMCYCGKPAEWELHGHWRCGFHRGGTDVMICRANEKKTKEIFLLTNPRCVYCGPMKRRLQSLNVPFKEIRADTPEGKAFLQGLGRAAGQGFPMLIVKEGGKILRTEVGLLSVDVIKAVSGAARIARF